jgi:hypothetical protein
MSGWWQARTGSEKRMIILCVIVAVVCVPLILTPPSGANKKLLSASDARQQYRQKAQEKQEKESRIGELQPEIDRLTYKEPPEQVIPLAIKALQETAKAAGIHIREIKPMRIRRIAGIVKVPLSVRFSCEFSKTVPFLYNTENPSGKLVIERFNVTAPDSKSKIVDVEAHVAFFTTNTAAPATETVAAAGN